MSRKVLSLRFPRLGVVRRFGLQSEGRQSEYGTPYAVNVRLEDSLTNRLRGGSWTGISTTSVSSAEYINLVTENGDNIVTESGGAIILGTRYSVVGSDARHWVVPGSDAPSSGTADCVYRDRLLRVDDTNSNAVNASRVGDHADWDFSADISDTLRATIFQFSETNEIGGDIVALVPHKDKFLLGFTADETWVNQGPILAPSRHNVSREVGIIAARAWCKNHDTVYFLSSRGLYSVGADGSGLTALSEDKLPEDLIGVDDDDCQLAYNHADRMVYIHLSSGVPWAYDTERQGFWPFDTDTSDSHVLIGPFQLGQVNSYGRVLNIQGTVAQGSGDVTWALVTGSSEEVAAANGKLAIEAAIAGNDYSSYVQGTGTFVAGRNHIVYPRTRAVAAVLWLSASSDWAYEGISMGVITSGKWR